MDAGDDLVVDQIKAVNSNEIMGVGSSDALNKPGTPFDTATPLCRSQKYAIDHPRCHMQDVPP